MIGYSLGELIKLNNLPQYFEREPRRQPIQPQDFAGVPNLPLTKRQLQVARYWCAGYSTEQIGKRLGMSEDRARQLTNQVMTNLDVNFIGQVVMKLKETGVELPPRLYTEPKAKRGPRRQGRKGRAERNKIPSRMALAVMEAQEKGKAIYVVLEDEDVYYLQKHAHQIAQRRGWRITAKHRDGKLEIRRKG